MATDKIETGLETFVETDLNLLLHSVAILSERAVHRWIDVDLLFVVDEEKENRSKQTALNFFLLSFAILNNLPSHHICLTRIF